MTGTLTWNDESGFWIVTDENGDVWDVIDMDGPWACLERRYGQSLHCGATWAANAGGSDSGTLTPVRDGVCCGCWKFELLSGWVHVKALGSANNAAV